MQNPKASTQSHPTKPQAGIEAADTLADVLSAEDRQRLEQIVAAAHAAQRRGHLADVEFGRHLREIHHLRLYREGGRTWEAFMEEEFELSAERGRQLIALADLHDELVDAGLEPLTKESHARAVIVLPTPALRAVAVERGRELAEAEGKRLLARHLADAVQEVAREAVAGMDDEGGDEAAREAVHARGGLQVVCPESDRSGEDATPYLPGRVVVPWDERLEPSLHSDGSRALTRADLDEAAELVWPVLGPDPWTAAVAWEAPAGPLTATLFSDRLAAPDTAPSPEDDGRARTVLVAPGVDLLHPEIPEVVAEEVIEAAGADPARLYIFLTAHPQRAGRFDWPENAAVCLLARDAASAEAASLAVALVPDDVGDASSTESVSDSAPHFVLLLRDCTEPVAPEVLRPFAWVLLRGKRTKQAVYDSVLHALPADRVHVGREVRANLKGSPLLAPVPVEPRPERRAVAVTAVGDRTKGPLRPPARRLAGSSLHQ